MSLVLWSLLTMNKTLHAIHKEYINNYYPVAGYKITYSVATMSYDNNYVNLRDYNNSLLSSLL